MKYKIIQTGSDGNATVVNDRILIDCGTSWKALQPHARALGLVLMTHEHSDHFRQSTVQRLAKDRPTLRWAAGDWLIQRLLDAGVDRRNIDVITPGKWYSYGQLGLVQAFETPHNVPNCGWKIVSNGDRLLYATDLGAIPDGLQALGYDYYLLEANHMEAELEARAEEKLAAGTFAYETAAAENHLSFEQATEWLAGQMGPDSIWIPMHQHKEKEGTDDGREANAVQEDN